MQIWAIREMLAADDSRLDLWQKLARIVDVTSRFGVVIYRELLEKRPDDVRAHMMFASYLAEQGRERDAMKYVQNLIERDLGSPLPWEQLIRFRIQQGRIANARATFVRMSDEFPDAPITRRTEARIALAERRYDDAVDLLRVLAAEFDTFEMQRLLGLAEYRSGRLKRAEDAVNRALAHSRDFSPETIRLKARIHDDLADWPAVLRSLSALAIRGHSISEAELMMRARAFYGIDQPEKGREVLDQILAGDEPPTAAAVEYTRREGGAHPEEAAAHLTAALAREPANPEVLAALVGIDLRAERWKLAIARINAAINTGHARPETLLLRAYVLSKAGKLERAEADALWAFEADPSLPGGVDLLYAIYKAQDRVDEARISFEEAEAAGVLHSGARLLLGRIYLRQGDTNRARKMLEQVLRDDPNSTGAKSDLAYLLAESKLDLDRAQRLAEEAQQSMSTDPNAADTVGFVYLHKGLHEAALQQFQHALELNAEGLGSLEPMLQYHIGLTLDAMNRKEEAANAFEKALALDGDFPEAEDARRRIERAHGPSADAPHPS
jgi:tetratricopeptide (TPR) repeat protein